jgi:hypothetical protein
VKKETTVALNTPEPWVNVPWIKAIFDSLRALAEKCPRCVAPLSQSKGGEGKTDTEADDNDLNDPSINLTAADRHKLAQEALFKGAENRPNYRPSTRVNEHLTAAYLDEPVVRERLPYASDTRSSFLSHDANFDDYENGPLPETLERMPAYYHNFPTNPYATPTEKSPWDDGWDDHGYRILRSFHQIFYNVPPQHHHEHFLPSVPHVERTDRDTMYIVHRGSHKRQVEVKDTETVSFSDMNRMAGDEDDEDGVNNLVQTFVCGRNPRTGKYLDLRVERDEVIIEPTDVDIQVDLDSLIWVTPRLRTRSGFAIQTLPEVGKFPPIDRHNHIYVELLAPRSQEDIDDGGPRQDYHELRFALATIPHIPFGKVGNGPGHVPVNVYIAFPRAKHRDETTGRRQTRVPEIVQRYWYNELLLPTLQAVVPHAVQMYYPSAVETQRKKGYVIKHSAISQHQLDKIQSRLKRIIQDNPERFNLFGSFFFIMDVRGFKLATIGDLDDSFFHSPWDEMVTRFPGLNFDYMQDREKGELYADVAVSYSAPVEAEDDGLGPIVGMWYISDVLDSFFKGGMTTDSKNHYYATMQEVGGVQAEMALNRARTVHLCFRQAYHQSFEMVRSGHQRRLNFVYEKDALACNKNFVKGCTDLRLLYSGGKEQSFGVRDEIRGSGVAVKDIIDNSLDRVSSSLTVCGQLGLTERAARQGHISPRAIPSYGSLLGFSSSSYRNGSMRWSSYSIRSLA